MASTLAIHTSRTSLGCQAPHLRRPPAFGSWPTPVATPAQENFCPRRASMASSHPLAFPKAQFTQSIPGLKGYPPHHFQGFKGCPPSRVARELPCLTPSRVTALLLPAVELVQYAALSPAGSWGSQLLIHPAVAWVGVCLDFQRKNPVLYMPGPTPRGVCL